MKARCGRTERFRTGLKRYASCLRSWVKARTDRGSSCCGTGGSSSQTTGATLKALASAKLATTQARLVHRVFGKAAVIRAFMPAQLRSALRVDNLCGLVGSLKLNSMYVPLVWLHQCFGLFLMVRTPTNTLKSATIISKRDQPPTRADRSVEFGATNASSWACDWTVLHSR